MSPLETVEALSFVVSGVALGAVVLRALVRVAGPFRLAASLFGLAALALLLWQTPALLGYDEDEVPWVELAETAFFFLVAAGVFTWSASLLARHAQRIERAYASLEAASREKQMFLDILGHDVRNPIAAASLRADVLRLKAPALAADAEAIGASLRKANGIIEQSLLLSRVESGALALSPVDLASLAERVAEGMRPLAAQRRVEIVVVASPAQARAHALLANAVENLLSNAVKWSPEGGRVELRVGAEAGRARVAVVDHGPGIAPADRARLFQRFERLGRAEKGIGLGLTIAARLAERHGGEILVEETAGGGATFTLSLPAIPPAGSGAPAPLLPAAAPDAA